MHMSVSTHAYFFDHDAAISIFSFNTVRHFPDFFASSFSSALNLHPHHETCTHYSKKGVLAKKSSGTISRWTYGTETISASSAAAFKDWRAHLKVAGSPGKVHVVYLDKEAGVGR